MELTILMPCLNEAETIAVCIEKAKKFLEKNSIEGEVLISDNGSSDDSVRIAESMGARVVHADIKGYGAALIKGCEEAYGEYIIMGDSDDSYDFENILPFLDCLRDGYDLVMGNRFKGGIEKDAMPWSHKYIGNPILSFIGRLFFGSNIGDFHCGLRGYNKKRILELNLHTTGMEYASEMVVMCELAHYRICEVPTKLKKDGRSRRPHLRSFRDGWRHLKFLFMYCPKWLFLYPGIILFIIGMIGEIWLSFGQITLGTVVFSIHTMLYCMLSIILGLNVIYFYIFTKLFAEKSRFLPSTIEKDRLPNIVSGGGAIIGLITFIIGCVISVISIIKWKENNFGGMEPERLMRIVVPAATMIEIGIQMLFASFYIGILRIDWRKSN